MYKKLFIFLFMIVFLAGCTTVNHIPLSGDNRQAVQAVYINPEIKKPDTMYEFASGSEYGMAFGPIGGAISGAANAKAAATTQQFAEANQIDIRNIIYKKWLEEMPKKTSFKLSKQLIDSILTTNITLYGISIPHGFSTDYVPVLAFNANLVRNNQIIWQDSGYVSPLADGMPRYKMAELRNDPKKLYAMWDKASEKIITDMLNNMISRE